MPPHEPQRTVHYGKVLVTLRQARGWNQKRLAAIVQVRSALISKYETGEKVLSRSTLERMVGALGFPLFVIDRTLSFLRGLPDGDSPRRTAAADADVERFIDETSAELGKETEDFFCSLFRRVIDTSRTLAAREMAWVLWRQLRQQSPEEQRALIEQDEEFWSSALVERICEESVLAAADSADEALALAELALFVARRVPGSEARRSRLEGYVMAFVGNAKRVGGDLPGADAAFYRSAALWQAGSGYGTRREEVRLLDLEISLRRAQRQLPRALALVDRALELDRNGPSTGRLLILRAKTLEELDRYEEAVATLRQAIQHVDGERDPRLPWVLRFNLLENLRQIGQHVQAQEMLPAVRNTAIDLGNELDLVGVLWLEGRLHLSFGRIEVAIATLEQVRGEYLVRGISYDAALVTLEMAEILAGEGRVQEVKELANLTAPIFRAQGVRRETLASLQLFCDAANREELTAEVARRLLAEIRRVGG